MPRRASTKAALLPMIFSVIILMMMLLAAYPVNAYPDVVYTEEYGTGVFRHGDENSVIINLYELIDINRTGNLTSDRLNSTDLSPENISALYPANIGLHNINVEVIIEGSDGFMYSMEESSVHGIIDIDAGSIDIANIIVIFEYNGTQYHISGIDLDWIEEDVKDRIERDESEQQLRVYLELISPENMAIFRPGEGIQIVAIAHGEDREDIIQVVARLEFKGQSFELNMKSNSIRGTYETDFFNLLNTGVYNLTVMAYDDRLSVITSLQSYFVVGDESTLELWIADTGINLTDVTLLNQSLNKTIANVSQPELNMSRLGLEADIAEGMSKDMLKNISVKIFEPAADEKFTLDDIIQLVAVVESNETISEVLAVLEWSEGRIVQQMYNSIVNNTYETDFFNAMDTGEYNFTVVARTQNGSETNSSSGFVVNDSLGKDGLFGRSDALSRFGMNRTGYDSNESDVSVVSKTFPRTEIITLNNKGRKMFKRARMSIPEVYKDRVATRGIDSLYTEETTISSLTVDNLTEAVEKIEFHNISFNGTLNLGVEDVEDVEDGKYIQSYAIDPTELNFTNATVTVTAKGTKLFKCRDWDFDSQTCYGEWELFIEDIIPGREYSFTLTADDPAFGETIDILNVQSYPTVWGKWTVFFNTTGKANLTIRAVNGTSWSDWNESDEDDDLRLV